MRYNMHKRYNLIEKLLLLKLVKISLVNYNQDVNVQYRTISSNSVCALISYVLSCPYKSARELDIIQFHSWNNNWVSRVLRHREVQALRRSWPIPQAATPTANTLSLYVILSSYKIILLLLYQRLCYQHAILLYTIIRFYVLI